MVKKIIVLWNYGKKIIVLWNYGKKIIVLWFYGQKNYGSLVLWSKKL